MEMGEKERGSRAINRINAGKRISKRSTRERPLDFSPLRNH
jgi:hypothetical protein